jgi:hypothetical protein
MNHTFPTFQHFIDRAIMTERKHREMEDRKREIGGSQVRSSRRPCYSGNLSHSSKVTNTNTSTNISVRATRHLAFLPQQPTKTTKKCQRKEEVMHVSTVGNKAIGRIIAQRKQLSSNQLPMS